MDIIKSIEHEQLKNEIPVLKIGDTVRVHARIKEGNRQRIQVFEGIIIKKQGGGVNETFTVRRISYGVGVEKTFLVHSPNVEKVEVVKFETDSMTEGKNYTITITSIGEGDYTDSDPYKLNFTYNKPEEKYYFKENRNQTVDEFKEYLISLGVKEEDIRGSEGEDPCTDENITLLSDSLSGKSFTRSELLSMIIEYTYCKIEDENEE